MAAMFHVGGEPFVTPKNRSRPEMIRNIASEFKELIVIAAHLGGLNMWEQAHACLAGMPNVYLESSLSYKFIDPDLGKQIIHKHGHTKIFFGTDYPFAPIRDSLAIARATPFLSSAEREDILGNNAQRFFCLP
jgi:hypothetical protein